MIDLIGDVVWDTHLAVPHLPMPGVEARATSRRRLLGGTASHVARWLHLLARAGLHSSAPPGIRVWAVLDAQAAEALAFCDTVVCPRVPEISEVFVLTRPDGEKAMISVVPPDLPARPLPARSSLFYLSAYTLLAPNARERIVEPCAALVAEGAQMVFDLAPLIHQMDRALVERLVGLARTALGNEEEWQRLFHLPDAREAALAGLALGAGTVHLKRGAQGSILLQADGSSRELPAAASQPVSTAGAGDAYTAAVLAALAAGRSSGWAQRLATFCGALHTEQRPDSENIAALRGFLTHFPA
ncbi:MAG TPA: carbohydrate kinase family protein [Ktedonobacterales bacterium]|nr:carbohydrate kinase family protein [Ktedonobacterales bacterium]